MAIEELRDYPGLENLGDESAQEIIDTLTILANLSINITKAGNKMQASACMFS